MTRNRTKTGNTVQRLVFQPDTYAGMQRGVNQVVDAIRPTLGPESRTVAIEQVLSNKIPELLDKGGIIARRITELPNRDSDMGAMYIRHMLWKLHDEMGDGTATAAVLFQAVYNQGLKYIAAGGNAMRLRQSLMQGMAVILDALDDMTQPIIGEDALVHLATSLCHDPELATIMGEVFDIIGEHGQLDVRTGRSRTVDREYVEGMYWNQGAVSRQMLSGGSNPTRLHMTNTAIIISDLAVEDVQILVAVVESLMKAGIKSLLIIGSKFSEDVINFLIANKDPEKFRAVAVKVPGLAAAEQMAALQDIAILTGGTPLFNAAGDQLNKLTPKHLGQARRLWVDRTMFGIVSGRRNARDLRQHLNELKARYEKATDSKEREALQTRIGKLMGGVATLLVGGNTELELKARKELAQQTAKTLRRAVTGGVVPGGGVALLDCQPPLADALANTDNSDERAAYRILHDAVAAPLRTICNNAGYDEAMVAKVRLAGPGHGLDVRTGEVVVTAENGIYDAAPVLKAVVEYAITSAALALTVDVLVHHKSPQNVTEP